MSKYVNIISGNEISIDELKSLTIDDFSDINDDAIVYIEDDFSIKFTGKEIISMIKNGEI